MDHPEESFLLFVYGTLTRGGGKDGLLEGARFIRPATVLGSLHDLGAWPALVLDGVAPVQGEIWQCPGNMLGTLDAYEAVEGGLFERVRVGVGADGLAWAYVAGPSLSGRLGGHNRIASGRWRPPSRVP